MLYAGNMSAYLSSADNPCFLPPVRAIYVVCFVLFFAVLKFSVLHRSVVSCKRGVWLRIGCDAVSRNE